LTRTGEQARAAVTSMRVSAPDANAAINRRRSAAAAAVPLPLRRATGAVPKSPVSAPHLDSSRPALCCFIATVPRSGSWLLAEALYNAGVAGHPHEYFRPDFREVWSHEWHLSPRASIDDYIAAALSQTRTHNGVFSVKVHWYQLIWLFGAVEPGVPFTRARAAELLEARFSPLRYVFLSRGDTARQAISYYRASRTQKWFATGTVADGFDPSSADLQQIRWFEDVVIEHRENWRRYFAASDIRPVEVQYESLATSYEETVAKLLCELGIDSPGPLKLQAKRTLRRQADDRTDTILDAYLRARDQLVPRGPGVRWDVSTKRFATTTSVPGDGS
jgi:trehalose 2-sulfotransferase